MPSDDDRLEPRVAALEREIVELRERVSHAGTDANAARVLAAGADRDVSEVRAELRAHTSALNALRETQVEFGMRLTGVEGRLTGVEGRLTGVEGRLTSLESATREGFATMSVGMAEITALLRRIVPEE